MSKRPFINFVKDLPMWLHIGIIMSALYLLSDHMLECLIVFILMYDIGFEIRGIDKFIEINNGFRRWVYKRFHKRKASK